MAFSTGVVALAQSKPGDWAASGAARLAAKSAARMSLGIKDFELFIVST
jgi:hypothetical protein